MKKALIIICIAVAALNANAQELKEADVPSAAKTKFISMYPNAQDVKWELENGMYEAEFEQNKIENSVLFEANGTYIQKEIEIAVSALPPGVSDYASKNLSGKKINEAAKITDAQGTVTYEAEIGDADYLFDASGNFIKKESSDQDTEDNDK